MSWDFIIRLINEFLTKIDICSVRAVKSLVLNLNLHIFSFLKGKLKSTIEFILSVKKNCIEKFSIFGQAEVYQTNFRQSNLL